MFDVGLPLQPHGVEGVDEAASCIAHVFQESPLTSGRPGADCSKDPATRWISPRLAV